MKKIAVIDDEMQIVNEIKELFEKEGYQVVFATDVKSALEIVQNEKPDLIIQDVMMQESDDGLYLANKYRQLGIATPIIMLACISKVTGYQFGVSDALPVDEFLLKPVSPMLLLEKAKRFLN